MRWERIGAVLCLALLALPGARLSTIPLRVTLLLSFVLMLADEYVVREPRRAAAPVQLPPEEPGDDHVGELTEFSWDVPVGQGTERFNARVRLDGGRYANLRGSNPGTRWNNGDLSSQSGC